MGVRNLSGKLIDVPHRYGSIVGWGDWLVVLLQYELCLAGVEVEQIFGKHCNFKL
jgi:hypothetical protein